MTGPRTPPDLWTGRKLNAVGRIVIAHPLLAALALLAIALTIFIAPGQSAHRSHRRTIANQAAPTARAPAAAATHAPANWAFASPSAVRTHRSAPVRTGTTAPGRAPVAERSLVPPQAREAAWRFLQTYVPFTYAQLSVNRIKAATPELQAHLAANTPNVPPYVHRLHPRIVVLAIVPAQIVDAGAGWAATSEVADGLETYRVTVKLGQLRGRWLVTTLLPGR